MPSCTFEYLSCGFRRLKHFYASLRLLSSFIGFDTALCSSARLCAGLHTRTIACRAAVAVNCRHCQPLSMSGALAVNPRSHSLALPSRARAQPHGQVTVGGSKSQEELGTCARIWHASFQGVKASLSGRMPPCGRRAAATLSQKTVCSRNVALANGSANPSAILIPAPASSSSMCRLGSCNLESPA